MNIKDLEWFGPPERNTLRPLCVVLLESGKLGAESSVRLRVLECIQRAPPFYISREARTWLLGPRQVGPMM